MTKEQFLSTVTEPIRAVALANNIPFEFMMSQIALETGWGTSSLFFEHWNVGGIKAYGTVASTLCWTWENVKTDDLPKYENRNKAKDKDIGKDKMGNQLTAIYLQLPFASFDNLTDGINYYLRYVLMNSYFKHYIAECGGDAIKYVNLLQSGGVSGKEPKYATDINYISKITLLINQFKNK